MADSAEVDRALVSTLLTDSALVTLMPDGVFWEVAPEGKQRFLIVSPLAHEDVPEFGDTAYETFVYLVKAVALDGSSGDVDAAAQRVKQLLDQNDASYDTALALAPTGYELMLSQRIERVRMTEVDAENEETWQHAGGHYEIWAQPTS